MSQEKKVSVSHMYDSVNKSKERVKKIYQSIDHPP